MNYYAEYERLVLEYVAVFDACNHPKQDCETRYHGKQHSCCIECARKAAPVNSAAHAEYKRARKAQLDAMPRCEVDGCNRRAPYTTFGVGLCGRHLRAVKREHERGMAGAGILAWLYPAHYSRDNILSMAGQPAGKAGV